MNRKPCHEAQQSSTLLARRYTPGHGFFAGLRQARPWLLCRPLAIEPDVAQQVILLAEEHVIVAHDIRL
jgi:hypothetical protein